MKKLPAITQSFQVQYDYQLHFTNNLFALDNPLLKDLFKAYSKEKVKLLVVIDEGVYRAHRALEGQIKSYTQHYGETFDLKTVIGIPGGERAKFEMEHLETVLSAINTNAICRHSFVLAIGGGALIDMVGYAANTAHRGVKLIRVPTTVLAQNDAAVGVKNSINYFGKKNFLGSFAPPFAIINDFTFLDTLEQRDWISGISEAVKVAAIKDAGFFAFLEQNAGKMVEHDYDAMAHMIYRCAALHMQHIANGGDPFESGSSRPLDFGHWAAHKLEQMTEYQLRHGEAVAMGIALDVTYAHMIGMISEKVLERILGVLQAIGFNLQLPINSEAESEELLRGIEEFREHLGGRLTITLLTDIGHKKDVHEIDLNLMRKAIAQRKESNVVSF